MTPGRKRRQTRLMRNCSSGAPAVSCARLPATAAAKFRKASWMGLVSLAASFMHCLWLFSAWIPGNGLSGSPL